MTNLIIANINKYITEKHIKKTWIAESLGVNKMNISKILSGKKKNVTLDELLSIIEVLDLNLEDVSKENFNVNNETQTIEDGTPEYIAFCGSISNEKTSKTIDLVGELIEIIHVFKKANKHLITE